MKKIIIFTFLISCCFIITLSAKNSKVGYGKIMLNMSKSSVNGQLASNYNGNKYSEQKNGDYILKTNEFTKVIFHFNHNKLLYKIFVKVKYGDASKLKKRLSVKYGKPVESFKNKLLQGENKYLIGKWLLENRYSVTIFESIYCRKQKLITCHIEIFYLDNKESKAFIDHKKITKERKEKEKDDKAYEGI